MLNPKNILITGASSGLGAALAESYAAPGCTMFLQGRNTDRLEQVAQRVNKTGARATTKRMDVAEAGKLKEWIANCDAACPLDLVIANAGISANTSACEGPAEATKAIFDTNLIGVLNTVHPVIPLMKKRKHGQIAIVSSLAGFHGVAKASAYCASKAAIRIYGEALRAEMASHGVEINIICPGFVKTPMTAVNDFPMPFLMNADHAAEIIKKGLEQNKPRIAFPWQMHLMVRLLSMFPSDLIDHFLAGMPGKSGPCCCKDRN